MSDVGGRLREIVEAATPPLLSIREDPSGRRPARDRWSPREVLGHLIDSAANNHARFVEACLQGHLVFDRYEQDAWVELQRYEEAPWGELVELWRAYNLHLARVIAAIPEEVLHREHARHNLHEIAWRRVPEGVPTTLGYLVKDYVGHLEHHLAQVLPRGTGVLPDAE